MNANNDEKVVILTTHHSEVASMFKQAGINRNASTTLKTLDFHTTLRQRIEEDHSEDVTTDAFQRYLTRSSQECLVKISRMSDPSNVTTIDFSKLHMFFMKRFPKATEVKQKDALAAVNRKSPIGENTTSSRTGDIVKMLRVMEYAVSFTLLSHIGEAAKLESKENEEKAEHIKVAIPEQDKELNADNVETILHDLQHLCDRLEKLI